MFSSRLIWKFAFGIGACYLIGASVTLALVVAWQRERLADDVRAQLRQSVALAREQLRATSPAEPTELASKLRRLGRDLQVRLTLIGGDGHVVADTLEEPERIPNQATQPEVRAAATGGAVFAHRGSAAARGEAIYLAERIDRQDSTSPILRASLSWSPAEDQLNLLRRRLLAAAMALGLALEIVTVALVWPIARDFALFTRSATAMSIGDFSVPVGADGQDELGAFGKSLHNLQSQISAQLERLRQNGDRLAALLGAMSEGVVAVDREGRVLFANSAARALLEFPTPDSVGRPLLECVRNRVVQEIVTQAFADNEPCRGEFEIGSAVRRTVAIHARRLPGIPSPGILIVLHDVTDLRRLEKLRQEFVANVSHELKTPLTVIKAYAETLLDGAISDAGHNRGFVEQIAEQAERLHQLILDLLSVARIESGIERFEFTSIPVHEVVEACVRRYKPAAESKSVQLETETGLDGLQVFADEEGLREILDNLVDNAIKYTPQGGRVAVRYRRDDANVCIEVADTGIGIPQDEQQRIFERFYRVDKARSRELGGTGLGLSIVKHLVSACGGTVAVASQPGKGSTFSVKLPLG